tara:strand:+ start:1178 stop:1864 length:687 start_codon:yes stop_codon:yes gene_type:complete
MGIGSKLGIFSQSGNSSFNNFSLDFDGSNDNVTFTDVTYDGEFTFSFWIKPEGISPTDNRYIAGKNSSASDYIHLARTTQILLDINGSSITFYTTEDGNAIELNVWNNVVVTRNGSSIVKAFRNGVAFGEATGSLSGDFDLGYLGGTNGRHYIGLMDEVALWKDSDQSANAERIYNGGVIRNLIGLLDDDPTYWYRFEEGSGTTANNTINVGEGTGTINGATYSTDTP